VRNGALAAAILVVAFVAGAWWFVARSEADGDAARRRAPDATPRGEARAPAESAAGVDATRTENRDAAVASPEVERAGGAGSSNWDQAAKTSGIELDVVDAKTRERLRDVTIEQGGENHDSATSREPPGGGPHALEITADSERVAVARGDAPLRIQLPPRMRRGRIRWLIGAPGHATVARWFDVTISGWRRHVVVLAAGGALDVVVRGGGVPQCGKVELFDDARYARSGFGGPVPEGRPTPVLGDLFQGAELTARSLRETGADLSFEFETTPAADVFERRIDALPCGHWIGLVTYGDRRAIQQHDLGAALVVAGESPGPRARLEFDRSKAPPPPPPQYAHFTGTVRFAPGWTADEVAAVRLLRFTALDAYPSFVPHIDFDARVAPTSDDHRLAFDAQWHPAVCHAVTFDTIPAVLAAYVEGTATAPDGSDAGDASPALDLFLDEPASVALRARDGSGAPRETVLFRFVAGPPECRHDRAGGRLATQADGATVRFRVPRGPFHFETEPRASVAFVERDLDLAAGESLLDVVASDYSGVRLRLRDGDVPMPWTFGTALVVARADSPGNPLDMRRRTTLHGSECQIDLEAPGHYVVFVRGVPGFEDPAPIELAVEPGNVVAIDVVVTTPR